VGENSRVRVRGRMKERLFHDWIESFKDGVMDASFSSDKFLWKKNK